MPADKLNISLIIILMILITSVFSGKTKNDEYIFHQLKVEDGLSQSTILSSIQDSRGYMWFATRSGLNRYDGYKFVVYLHDPKDPSSLSDDGTSALYEDKNGIIWIGTIDGNLNKFDRKTETFTYKNVLEFIDTIPEQKDEFYEYPLSFSRNQTTTITSITEDTKGNIWISTWGKGIIQIDKNFNKVNHFFADKKNPKSLPTNRVMDLLFDEKERLWIATFGGGLCRLTINNNNKSNNFVFENFSIGADEYSLSDSKLITLFQDSKKNLWVGTFYGGVNFIEANQLEHSPGTIKIFKQKCPLHLGELKTNTVMSIVEDKSNFIWIGTFGGGLLKYDPIKKNFKHFFSDPLNSNSLGDNDVLSLCVDRSGIIWAGSHLGTGITKIRVNNTLFMHIKNEPSNPNSLNDNVVWAIYQDEEGMLWIGTYKGGLNKYDPEKNKFSFLKNVISSNHIRSIKEDNYGNLWIGTYDGGLNIFNKKTNQTKVYRFAETDPQSIGGNQIQDIFIDDNNTYWIAVFGGGLNKISVEGNPFDKKLKFIKYKNSVTDNNTISDNRVYKIFKSKDGTYWIGTFGGGLNKFNPETGQFVRFPTISTGTNIFNIQNLMTITEDSDGLLWLGSFGGGLTSYDRIKNKFMRYSSESGITSNVVYGILEDVNKNLWISSDDGLFKLRLSDKDVRRFDMQDGLQSLEFNGGAYYKGKDNKLFFGGINGFNFFNPDEIKTNNYIPQVVITSVKIFNEPYKGESSKIILDHKKNFLTFEFASLDYSDPADNQYSFMLEGLQDEWQFTDASNRIANYTNLAPGTYTFKVRGSNSEGIWNENYASLKIEILRPFWQMWWFYLMIVLLLAWIIYYISTLRIKNLLAIERLKSKLAADLHDNIGSGLTEISILSEVAARQIIRDQTKSSSDLSKVSDIARQLVDNMSEIVWVINPQRDSLHDLLVRLKNSYSEILESMGISLVVTRLDKIKDVKLPMEFKQNIYSILKEAINNSIKHSQCKKITLSVNLRNDVLEISAEDDGKGFDENKIKRGNGLKNIEQRARQIGGRIKIKSSDSGTAIRFIGRPGRINKLKTLITK